MSFIIMGVSGCGKTTIGLLLSEKLRIPFLDADDFHSQVNRDKMKNGIPLTDDDRFPWLQLLSRMLNENQEKEIVLACSALKESYRKILDPERKHNWIFLHGEREVLFNRIKNRKGHYMPPELLDSQLQILEKPLYGLHFDIELSSEKIIDNIQRSLNMKTSEFGIIGIGVMGKNLALNLAKKNVAVSVYNRHVEGKEEKVAEKIVKDNPNYKMQGFDRLEDFIQSLQKPRLILMMVNAGKPVDDVISQLLPFIEEGDILIDGGNSLYEDSNRRSHELAEKNIGFIGLGVSGGEEGARNGASLMAGGKKECYSSAEKFLNLIAAKDRNGKACCALTGSHGSGHFVKMVHNGIEYAEMQLLAETYGFLRNVCNVSPDKIREAFSQWQSDETGSYLLEITIDILQKKEGDDLLLDKILDAAEQKGSGSWSAKAALDLGVPFGPIAEAVMARSLSARKILREEARRIYVLEQIKNEIDEKILTDVKKAYQAARIINHATGFDLMAEASRSFGWGMDLSEIARIWTSGCIIRSRLMERLSVLLRNNSRILFSPEIVIELKSLRLSLTKIICIAAENDYPLPSHGSCLNYFNGLLTANSPANLIQAQRDYFGAHTFRRIDAPADKYFHAEWKTNKTDE
jgi:6-phosphogluconate dehydrogenase